MRRFGKFHLEISMRGYRSRAEVFSHQTKSDDKRIVLEAEKKSQGL